MRRWALAAGTVVFLAVGLVGTGSGSAATTAIVPGHLPYPSGGTNAIGPGIDSGNQNAQLAENIGYSIKASWHAEPPLCPQTAGSDATSFSVAGSRTVAVDRQYQCSWLSAYDTATGALLWRRQYHFAQDAKIDGSTVYLEHDDPNGAEVLDAVDLATGKLKWTAPDTDGYTSRVSSIGSGLVLNSTWAIDAATGAHRFTIALSPDASTGGTAFVAGGRIFYNSFTGIQANSVTTGALLWSYRKQNLYGPGSNNTSPALHNGLLYINSDFDIPSATTLVLNPATGAVVRTLPRSGKPIAFDGTTGIFTATDNNKPAVISAVNLDTGAVYWTHRLPAATDSTGPTTLWAPPVVANGLVWILDAINTGLPGHVAALDEVTGATRSIKVESCAAAAGSLILAQHRIFASSNCGTLTYVAS